MILQKRKHRALEGEDETGGLVRILAEQGPAMGEFFEELANIVPTGGRDVLVVAPFEAGNDQAQEVRRILFQRLFFEVAGGAAVFEIFRPVAQQVGPVRFHRIECAGLQCRHGTLTPWKVWPMLQILIGTNQ
ncbi:hypothetical protein D3C86_1418200 [compost metagenome]